MTPSKDESKAKLIELIDKHQRFKNEGRLKGINEETTKQWIDDLFRILGWDFVEDVVKEYGTGKRKRVDYAFQITGTTKFLLEAKAYGEELDEKHIKQTLEYGYQNNKTWVVLTNFREIRVYNAKYYDKEEHIRRLFEPIKIEDAVVRLDDLWVLSREGIKESLISQLANKYGKVKPKEAIDTLIFEDLLRWRKALEKGIKEHERLNRIPTDPSEAEKYVDEAVQKILDRIIFVRVCEDRGLEEEELLRWCVKQWKADKKNSLMNYLSRLFSKKNSEYNSGIFAAHYSENLTIENEALETIIEESYVNQNGLTYDFSAIDADILGTIYENYLAYIQKKVWDKEEKQKTKRKSQGIYYTPTYIVDYIVKNTLGEKLKECEKPEDALKIKVIDPACGSGSFLIRSYDEFKAWHINYLRKNGEKQQTLEHELKGTMEFMDKVLSNCIYGVDLDAKAVELAQLNLLLKAAQGKHKLPTLNHNIQCGNSLIDDPAIARERAFKWEEKFPEVFKNGRFDVVVGNPPYGAELNEIERTFLEPKFKLGNTDTACLFIGLAEILLDKKGINGFIIPKPFVYSSSWKKARELILNGLTETVDCGKVWKDVKLEQVIYFFRKGTATDTYNSCVRKNENIVTVGIIGKTNINEFGFLLNGISDKELKLGQKIFRFCRPLNDLINNQRGGMFQKDVSENPADYKVLGGAQIGRYRISNTIKGYVSKKALPDKKAFIENNAILVQNIVAHIENPVDHIKIIATLPDKFTISECVILDTVNQLKPNGDTSSKLLLAIINSQIISWYGYRFIFGKAIRTMHFDNSVTERIPFPKTTSEKTKTLILSLVDQMLYLNKQLFELPNQSSNEAQNIKVEIQKTDKEIDRLVYELYGLTEEEIKIVEESFSQT